TGWFADADANEAIGITQVYTSDTTIFAGWSEVPVVVAFNANGGSVNPSSAVVGANGRLASLPTPTRSGFLFAGWFTLATEGDGITTDTVFAADSEIFAHWTQVFSVTFAPNGGVLPTGTSPTAATGETVRLRGGGTHDDVLKRMVVSLSFAGVSEGDIQI
ncbi:MAG: InlB B-repeat-containing protein, partial [Oscillospiraceae bacterium]|nr:InlB B-repeat-containing protein [Oscillospiraceae bacterium]